MNSAFCNSKTLFLFKTKNNPEVQALGLTSGQARGFNHEKKTKKNLNGLIFLMVAPRGILLLTRPGLVALWETHGFSILFLGNLGKSFPQHPLVRFPKGFLFKTKNTLKGLLFIMVAPRGIEPRLPGWKPGVLTTRRWRQKICLNDQIIAGRKWFVKCFRWLLAVFLG